MKEKNKKAQTKMEPLMKILLWVVFFVIMGIGVYYLIKFSSDSKLNLQDHEFQNRLEKLVFKWFDLNNLEEVEIYPTFLRTSLKDIKPYPEHIIHKDN